eukprot:jgi/Antlo1/1919/2471
MQKNATSSMHQVLTEILARDFLNAKEDTRMAQLRETAKQGEQR